MEATIGKLLLESKFIQIGNTAMWEMEKFTNHLYYSFKRQQDRRQADSDDEFEDDLVERRSRMTGFSVSSSAMHRNPQLTLLDARFDKVHCG